MRRIAHFHSGGHQTGINLHTTLRLRYPTLRASGDLYYPFPHFDAGPVQRLSNCLSASFTSLLVHLRVKGHPVHLVQNRLRNTNFEWPITLFTLPRVNPRFSYSAESLSRSSSTDCVFLSAIIHKTTSSIHVLLALRSEMNFAFASFFIANLPNAQCIRLSLRPVNPCTVESLKSMISEMWARSTTDFALSHKSYNTGSARSCRCVLILSWNCLTASLACDGLQFNVQTYCHRPRITPQEFHTSCSSYFLHNYILTTGGID